MLLNAEGNTDDWPTDLTERGKLLSRASRRIDQLAFNDEWEVPYSPRYLNGYLNDGKTGGNRTVKIPASLATQVALLALWYAQNPHGFYNQSPAGEESLCKQLSDLPLSIQTGLWRFLDETVKIDEDEAYFIQRNKTRPAAQSLEPITGSDAAGDSPLVKPLAQGYLVDASQVYVVSDSYGQANKVFDTTVDTAQEAFDRIARYDFADDVKDELEAQISTKIGLAEALPIRSLFNLWRPVRFYNWNALDADNSISGDAEGAYLYINVPANDRPAGEGVDSFLYLSRDDTWAEWGTAVDDELTAGDWIWGKFYIRRVLSTTPYYFWLRIKYVDTRPTIGVRYWFELNRAVNGVDDEHPAFFGDFPRSDLGESFNQNHRTFLAAYRPQPKINLTDGWQSGGATFRYVAADATLYVAPGLVDPSTITADTTGVKAIEAFDV